MQDDDFDDLCIDNDDEEYFPYELVEKAVENVIEHDLMYTQLMNIMHLYAAHLIPFYPAFLEGYEHTFYGLDNQFINQLDLTFAYSKFPMIMANGDKIEFLAIPACVGTSVMPLDVSNNLAYINATSQVEVLTGKGTYVIDYVMPKIDGRTCANLAIKVNGVIMGLFITCCDTQLHGDSRVFSGEEAGRIFPRYLCQTQFKHGETFLGREVCNLSPLVGALQYPENIPCDGLIVSAGGHEYKVKEHAQLDLMHNRGELRDDSGHVWYSTGGLKNDTIYEVNFVGTRVIIGKIRADKVKPQSGFDSRAIMEAVTATTIRTLLRDKFRMEGYFYDVGDDAFYARKLITAAEKCAGVVTVPIARKVMHMAGCVVGPGQVEKAMKDVFGAVVVQTQTVNMKELRTKFKGKTVVASKQEIWSICREHAINGSALAIARFVAQHTGKMVAPLRIAMMGVCGMLSVSSGNYYATAYFEKKVLRPVRCKIIEIYEYGDLLKVAEGCVIHAIDVHEHDFSEYRSAVLFVWRLLCAHGMIGGELVQKYGLVWTKCGCVK